MTPENRLIARVVMFLLVGFALIIVFRHSFIDQNNLPGGDTHWQVKFSAKPKIVADKAEIHIAPLQNTAFVRVFAQSIFHPDLRQKRITKKAQSRDIILVSNAPGVKSVEVSFEVQLSPFPRPVTKNKLREKERERWLVAAPGIFVDAAAAVEIIAEMRVPDPVPSEVARHLFDYVSERVSILKSGSDDGGIASELRAGSSLGVTRALISMLRSAHLPARLVTGLDLSAREHAQMHYWLEAYYEGEWHVMDVVRGNFDMLSRGLIPVIRDFSAIMRLNGVDDMAMNMTVRQHPGPVHGQSNEPASLLQIFDLTRINPQGREAMALLMLLPIGILLTEFLRQFVGIRTYGTFTPTLLALSAVFVDIKTAAVVFALVILFGVAGRSLLPGLRLTRVARLSIVFTMVATIMVFAVSTLLYFDPGIDTAVVLLPIVVLTTLVDRFYSMADELGIKTAFKRLLWTIAASGASLVVLVQGYLGHWLLQYPEFHLLTIAVIILFGRYRGVRLCDIPSFRWIAEPAIPGRKKLSSELDI